METLVFILLALLLGGAATWLVLRARRIRRLTEAREAAALAALQAEMRPPPPAPSAAPAQAPRPARPTTYPVPPLPDQDAISQILSDDLPLPAPRSAERLAQVATAVAEVPLRSMVLAWFEARGYRLHPLAPTAAPIEGVLVHAENIARSYAFMVDDERVTPDRISTVLELAAELGLRRVALVAAGGSEPGMRENARRRHVRLLDRAVIEAELAALAPEATNRIVAAARVR